MLTHRRKGDQESYHSVIKIEDADKKWCEDFAKNYVIPGLEIFTKNKNLMMFGEYEIKDSDQRTSWYWVDSVREHEKIIKLTKKELGKYFSETKPTKKSKNPNGIIITDRKFVPAGQGLRHEAILLSCFDYLKTAAPDERTAELLENHLFQDIRNIENLSDYEKDESKHTELKNLIKYAIDNYSNAGSGLVRESHDYATIDGLGVDNQFNCWIYDKKDCCWIDESAKMILAKLKILGGDDEPTTSQAIEIAKQLTVSEGVLKIKINPEYMKQKMTMMIDDYGHYFDFLSGEIKNIDPKKHFFIETDLKYELLNDTQEPTEFINFLKARCGEKNYKIVIDHLATIFLHNSILGSKPKMTYYVGDHNTYKSLIIGLVQDIVKSQSNVAVSQLLKDNFSPALLANKLLNYSEEEEVSIVQNQAMLKDLITKLSGPYRDMYSTKLKTAYRWPRWEIACNRILPLGKNDENDSMLIRTNYIPVLPVADEEPKYYDVFTDVMKQGIMMFLLHRAYVIYKKPGTIITQELAETKAAYEELTIGDLVKFIEKYYEKSTKSTGVGFVKFVNDYKKNSGVNITKQKITFLLNEIGLEKRERVDCKSSDEGGHDTYDQCSRLDGVQKTLIMGLKEKVSVVNKTMKSTNLGLFCDQ